MGCFLACFGFSNNRNRRKHNHKRHGSYEPLDSPITILSLDTVDSEPRHKPKDQLSSKIRKKVSFNLNVQTYEPISVDYHFLSNQENDAKTKEIKENEETGQRVSSNVNYRYQNCGDYYDEEDEIAFEDSSDLDDYEDDYDFIVDDDCDDIESKRDEILEEKPNAGKSEYVHSVLKPVENLSQWRAAKAREAAPPAKQQNERKENVPLVKESGPTIVGPDCRNYSKPLLQEVSIDSSLSNWLNSSST